MMNDLESFSPAYDALTFAIQETDASEISEDELSFVAAAAAGPLPFADFLKQHGR